ncbi:MAG TPA: hypothetical protein VJ866_07905 [Pyrinomonadaceae bacterium]|nr:hypothetical protein [Pyrinomonadaceae bacterium]
MSRGTDFPKAWARACAAALCALGLALAALSYEGASAGKSYEATPSGKHAPRAAAGQERVDIRLRSLTTSATGQLTVEASEGGGRARLTALNLPDPRTVAEGATTYVVWAVSGRSIVRLGELRRSEGGNGGLAFDRPAGLERYGVIVTAEASADVERPGDPVLTTRADEAAALYPSAAAPAPTPDSPAPVPAPTPNIRRPRTASAAAAGDFYAEVDDALYSQGGGRLIELDGDSAAPKARGAARATLRERRAYVRANFSGVPLPTAVNASVYVLWGVVPDGRIVYMGSLPATNDLNRAEVYVRVAGFESDDYTLFVTAERRRPVPAPEGRRLLKPKDSASIK